MKLLKKFVSAFSASHHNLTDSMDKLDSPAKRRKITDHHSEEIPLQLIQLPVGTSVLQLNEQQYSQVSKRASYQLEIILKKSLKMSRKEALKAISAINNNHHSNEKIKFEGSIFGCPLASLPSDLINTETQLPKIIVSLMHSFVSRGGFDIEGPFRIEGDKQQLAQLVDGISLGFEVVGLDLNQFPISVLAAAIKRYLRSIPGFLIPQGATEILAKLYNLKDSNLKALAIRLFLFTLPYQQAKVFAAINLLLKACSTREQVHKMSANALSVCFGPTLFDTGIDLKMVTTVNNLLNEILENYSNYSTVPAVLN